MSKVKLLLYCTKAKPYIGSHTEYNGERKQENSYRVYTPHNFYNKPYYNGKIVAECEVETEKFDFASERFCNFSDINDIEKYNEEVEKYNAEINKHNILLKHSCLNAIEMVTYLDKEKLGQENLKGYALHLSNLKIFDKPLAFDKDYIYKDYKGNELISKAPQNMCRVYDRFGNKYILISIRPEWICKILNGEKTIEVRKQVIKELKEMKEND